MGGLPVDGGHTRGEFEHAEVAVFVGKNPWMSQSFPRARLVLREIAKDPKRSMIVIDPVVTDTAKLADFHLRVRPGSDAWCLAALGATLVQEDLLDDTFIAEHVTGSEPTIAALAEVPVGDYAQRCGVDEALIRAAARRIAGADVKDKGFAAKLAAYPLPQLLDLHAAATRESKRAEVAAKAKPAKARGRLPSRRPPQSRRLPSRRPPRRAPKPDSLRELPRPKGLGRSRFSILAIGDETEGASPTGVRSESLFADERVGEGSLFS